MDCVQTYMCIRLGIRPLILLLLILWLSLSMEQEPYIVISSEESDVGDRTLQPPQDRITATPQSSQQPRHYTPSKRSFLSSSDNSRHVLGCVYG